MAPRFHPLRLAEVRRETAEAVVLVFNLPEDLRETFAFVPGQYLTLRADIDGAEVRRSYSISAPLASGRLEVAVKRIPGGVFSGFAQGLKAGDVIETMPPQGRFTAPVGGRHDYLLLAAGSGITPIVSIAASVLEGEPDSTVTLFYANRTTASIMFRERLEDLKDRFMTRFRLTHLLDEEAQDVELFNGRIDREKLETLATRGLIRPTEHDAIYLCGPQPMTDAAVAALTGMGVAPERIRTELFTAAGAPPVAGAREPAAAHGGELARVEVILDGAHRRFPAEPGESVLAAAARAGLELPWSCANGMCATCRCKLAEGSVEMAQNFALEPWELEAGYVLACQSRPTSARLVLDFDAV